MIDDLSSFVYYIAIIKTKRAHTIYYTDYNILYYTNMLCYVRDLVTFNDNSDDDERIVIIIKIYCYYYTN